MQIDWSKINGSATSHVARVKVTPWMGSWRTLCSHLKAWRCQSLSTSSQDQTSTHTCSPPQNWCNWRCSRSQIATPPQSAKERWTVVKWEEFYLLH